MDTCMRCGDHLAVFEPFCGWCYYEVEHRCPTCGKHAEECKAYAR